jgi:2-keto-4-pentenoate hydratase/2-oxohepta-3-ene-1,7-dioic acid hydratase in catechol pathway
MPGPGTIALDAVELMPPIPRPPKLLGLAGNYLEHIREFDRPGDQPEDSQAGEMARTTTPRPFLMPSTAAIPPGGTIPWPSYSREIDYEIELAVVIGRRCRRVSPAEAAGHVAGYTIANDVSARSCSHAAGRQERAKDAFFDWLHGKWADGFCPMGPYLVTAEEIADPHALAMELRVDGEVRQQASTRQMIHSVAEVVAFCSQLMTLEPGDVIATGTPSGVGAATGRFLRPGQRIRCRIEGLGELENTLGEPPAEFYRPCGGRG